MSHAPISVRVLLARVSTELADLAAAGLRLEDAVGDLVADTPTRLSPALQELDQIVQRLRDLAEATAGLAHAAPDQVVDAAPLVASLKLARSRAAIGGFRDPPTGQAAGG